MYPQVHVNEGAQSTLSALRGTQGMPNGLVGSGHNNIGSAKASGPQSVVLRSTISASPGSLLDMQSLWPFPDLMNENV